MSETLKHPQKSRLFKVVGLSLLSMVIMAGIAYGTITVLSVIAPKSQSTAQSLTPEQQAAEKASQDLKTATAKEAAGDTAAAIASYKEALANYQTAGDQAGEQGVKLKLQYLESLK